MKYRKAKRQKQNRLIAVAQPATATAYDMDDLVRFFETCLLPRDTKKVKDKLFETADSRRNVLAQDQQCFSKMLNIYRIDPSLVSVCCQMIFIFSEQI